MAAHFSPVLRCCVPAPVKSVSQARQTAASAAAGSSFSHALYGKGAAPLVAAVGTHHGCPYGDACMYTTSGWSNNTPEHEYYYYGCYNLSNEYGTRIIYNNQSGSAVISGFSYYGCYGAVQWTETPGLWFKTDITPINSVRLASN
jgi:hypothetical protein